MVIPAHELVPGDLVMIYTESFDYNVVMIVGVEIDLYNVILTLVDGKIKKCTSMSPPRPNVVSRIGDG